MRCLFCKELNDSTATRCSFCQISLLENDLLNLLPQNPPSHQFLFDADFYEIFDLHPMEIYDLLRDIIEKLDLNYRNSNYNSWDVEDKLLSYKRVIFHRKRANLLEAVYLLKVGAFPRQGSRGNRTNQDLLTAIQDSYEQKKRLQQIKKYENGLQEISSNGVPN